MVYTRYRFWLQDRLKNGQKQQQSSTASATSVSATIIIISAILQVVILNPLKLFRGSLGQFSDSVTEIDLEIQQLQFSGSSLGYQWSVYLKVEEASVGNEISRT